MKKSVITIAVLHAYLDTYGTFCGTADAAKEFGPARLADIVLASHSLTDEERRDAHNVFVQAFATARRVKAHQSQRATKPFNFIGLTIEQKTKSGHSAQKACWRKLYVLHPRSPEAAEKLAARLTAPRVITKPSSKDKATALAKQYSKLTVAQKRWFMAAIELAE
jgi:hypothetical protein